MRPESAGQQIQARPPASATRISARPRKSASASRASTGRLAHRTSFQGAVLVGGVHSRRPFAIPGHGVRRYQDRPEARGEWACRPAHILADTFR